MRQSLFVGVGGTALCDLIPHTQQLEKNEKLQEAADKRKQEMEKMRRSVTSSRRTSAEPLAVCPCLCTRCVKCRRRQRTCICCTIPAVWSSRET